MNHVRLFAGAMLALGASVSLASDRPADAAPDAGGAAQMMFLDPVTGEIRAPAAEDWANVPRPATRKAKAQERVLPDGMLLLPAESVMHEMSATIAPDGSVQMRCLAHEHE